jgi:NADPH-dependent 7-cyano-7-deazaguanine reductase QueF
MHEHTENKWRVNRSADYNIITMPLQTIANPHISSITRETHEVQVPPLCPRTANPISGSTLTISYVPNEKLLEFYSLRDYVASFIGSQDVRDLELFTQVVARDCHAILGVHVTVTGRFILNIDQIVTCECEA